MPNPNNQWPPRMRRNRYTLRGRLLRLVRMVRR